MPLSATVANEHALDGVVACVRVASKAHQGSAMLEVVLSSHRAFGFRSLKTHDLEVTDEGSTGVFHRWATLI